MMVEFRAAGIAVVLFPIRRRQTGLPAPFRPHNQYPENL